MICSITVYGHEGGKYGSLGCPVRTELVLNLVSVGKLVVDQLIVGTTGRTALGTSLVEPEPHDSGVVFLTCREDDMMVNLVCYVHIHTYWALMCITYKDSPPASWFQCTAQCEGPPWCQHTPWASAC